MFDEFPTTAAVQQADPLQLAVAVGHLSREQILALPAEQAEVVVAATQRVISAMSARQTVALESFTCSVTAALNAETEEIRRECEADGSRIEPIMPDPLKVAGSMIAPVLRVAPATMYKRAERAMLLVNALPRTLTMAWCGDLEPYRVDRVLAAAGLVDWQHHIEFEARLYARDVTDLAGSKLGARAEGAAAKADPHSLAHHAKEAPQRRRLQVSPGDDIGLTRWDARLPVGISRRMFAAVDALAHEYLLADVADGASKARTIDHARADALADLVLANAEISTTVEVIIHAAATDGTDAPDIDVTAAEILGVHPDPASPTSRGTTPTDDDVNDTAGGLPRTYLADTGSTVAGPGSPLPPASRLPRTNLADTTSTVAGSGHPLPAASGPTGSAPSTAEPAGPTAEGVSDFRCFWPC